MKIISIFGSAADITGMPRMSAGADSAILRQGDPLFVPDHLGAWDGEICPAIRICRLGLNIPLKAARSYYDAITAMHIHRPADGNRLTDEAVALIDRAFAPGLWIPLGSDTASCKPISLSIDSLGPDGSSDRRSLDFSPESLGADAAIAALSKLATVKTGDIIVFRRHSLQSGPAMRPDSTGCFRGLITASIDGRDCMKLKIR